MRDIADWTAASVPLETMEIEIVFLLEPTFYTGDPNDHTQFDDPQYRVALPAPALPRTVESMARTAEAVGHEAALIAYYAEIVRLAREIRSDFNAVSHYFWLRLWLWHSEREESISFPWYDTLSEMRPFFRWLEAEDEHTFFDADQGWELVGAKHDGRVHLRMTDGDDEEYANISVPRAALALAARQVEQRADAVIASLTKAIGFDAWSARRRDDPLADAH